MCAGAVNPDLADPLSLSNISDLTGMKFSWQGLGDEEYYKGDLELTSQGEKFCLSKKEGDILFDEKLNFYNTYNNALRIVPLAVEESSGMETLARFKSTGKAAWAIKKFDDYSAMYIASSRMPAEALSRLADIAGVHRYGAPGNVLYANESLILYHPGSKGRHKIKLPNKTDIYELYSGEWIGEGKDEIVEYLDLGQTRFYLLGNKENLEPAIKSAEEKFSTRLKEIKQKQQDGIADRLKKKNKGDGPFYAGYGGSIENYLVLSSIPIAKKNGNLKEDAIRMMERKLLPDEASFVPAPGQNMSIDGAQKSWTRIWHDSLFFDCPAMTGSLEGDEIAVFYLFVEVELPEDMKFKIKFWNDDYLVIYFNGEKVLPLASVTSFGARPLVLNGKKGRNRFLIKLANTGGPGGFGMQLRSIDDKGLRGMKYYLSSKSEK
jgi:hypothetical protein